MNKPFVPARSFSKGKQEDEGKGNAFLRAF
jgi:hypothetical protein